MTIGKKWKVGRKGVKVLDEEDLVFYCPDHPAMVPW